MKGMKVLVTAGPTVEAVDRCGISRITLLEMGYALPEPACSGALR